ncbi:MAG TPA: hypothetical protein VKA64_08760 [Gammaproteobacteria bacterium]|nr:hypothetical protein [Gammaproteobacteria bacterium]
MRRWSRFLALLFLVATQWALSAHTLDLEAHEEGETCHVCLVGEHLGHGLTGAPAPSGPAPALGPAPRPASYPFIARHRFDHRLAPRAPPRPLSS